jgi:hypothetical protein
MQNEEIPRSRILSAMLSDPDARCVDQVRGRTFRSSNLAHGLIKTNGEGKRER